MASKVAEIMVSERKKTEEKNLFLRLTVFSKPNYLGIVYFFVVAWAALEAAAMAFAL